MKPAFCGFGPRQVEKLVRKIDSKNPSARAYPLRCRQSGGAGTAPDVKHRRAPAELKSVNSAPTNNFPIGKRSIVIMVRRAVKSCGYFDLGGLSQIEFFHARLPAIAAPPQTLAAEEIRIIRT